MRPCNECKWVGGNWFIFITEYRACKHPLVKKEKLERNPAGDGSALVGIERLSGNICGPNGTLWNTNKDGKEE